MSESQTQIGFIEQSETFSRIQPDIGAMESQVNNLGEKGSRTNGGANFKINLFDINLGLTISM